MNSKDELRRHRGLVSVVALLLATSCSGSPMSNLADAAVPGSDAATDASKDTGGAALAWTPGHYVLLITKLVADETAERDSLLNGLVVPPYPSPVITPFAGMLIKYYWADFEGAQRDYSAGFAHLDADTSKSRIATFELDI